MKITFIDNDMVFKTEHADDHFKIGRLSERFGVRPTSEYDAMQDVPQVKILTIGKHDILEALLK